LRLRLRSEACINKVFVAGYNCVVKIFLRSAEGVISVRFAGFSLLLPLECGQNRYGAVFGALLH